MLLGGVDIGGTKCAVSLGVLSPNGTISVLEKCKFPTKDPKNTLLEIENALARLLKYRPNQHLKALGISCGGPLDSKRGLVLSPPNLPGWDRVDVFTPLKLRFQVPIGLENDANACALAEWQWGAGQGSRNMIFLTFGTGMGAGLILNGQLYRGANDLAGEVGHIRLENDGPVGYGKNGSFEGFCSGGGIAKLAKSLALEHLSAGKSTAICDDKANLLAITAQSVGEAAQGGDALALEVYHIVGEKLGKGLSILVDTLNPEKIIIGSIYLRQQSLLEPIVLATLKREALPQALASCQILPAGLGEAVGDYAGLSVAQCTFLEVE